MTNKKETTQATEAQATEAQATEARKPIFNTFNSLLSETASPSKVLRQNWRSEEDKFLEALKDFQKVTQYESKDRSGRYVIEAYELAKEKDDTSIFISEIGYILNKPITGVKLFALAKQAITRKYPS